MWVIIANGITPPKSKIRVEKKGRGQARNNVT